MWAKWVLSNSGERYLDSIELVIDDPSKATRREAIAYFILDGIKSGLPLTAIQQSLTYILESYPGAKDPYRVLQRSLEDYERNRWVKETEEEFTSEEMNEADSALDLSKETTELDIPDAFKDFKDHF